MLRNHKSGIGSGGFTLVEILIATAVAAIVMLGLMTIFRHLDKTWISEELKADMQQNARVAMDNMVRDMMMMGYGSPGVSGRLDKILVAEEGDLEFVLYTDDPTKPKSNSSDVNKHRYRIRYYLSGDQLKKEYCRYDGTLFDDGDYVKDFLLAEGVKDLTFEYYTVNPDGTFLSRSYDFFDDPVATDDTYDECNDPNGDHNDDDNIWGNMNCLDFQKNRDDIRRIVVTVEVETGRTMPGTNEKKTITLRADISPRNMWEGEASFDLDPPSNPTPPPDNDPTADGVPTDTYIKVRDTGECGKLQVKWAKFSDSDVESYVIKYGISATLLDNYINVSAADFDALDYCTAEIDNCSVQKFTDGFNTNEYYVYVYAYDNSGNASDPLIFNPPATDPYPDITDFIGEVDDCTVNIPKPDAVTSFTASSAGGATPQTLLTWSASSDPNVVGYRIFRNTTTFPTDPGFYPIPKSYMIAKESDDGDTWTGPRTSTAGSFTDTDAELIGCKEYYYAICPVTCDATRIYGHSDPSLNTDRGGIYTDAQYSFANTAPSENTRPTEPGLSATAGYRRVFLNLNWPADLDYAYTKIYAFPGGADTSSESFSYSDVNLIPDHGAGITDRGTFEKWGTAAEDTVVYNDENNDIPDDAFPQLPEIETLYTFIAVAYDRCDNASLISSVNESTAELCGDDPCGAPSWNVANPTVWIDPATTSLDTSQWYDSNQIQLGLQWTPVDKTDVTTAQDFRAYYVTKDVIEIPADGAGSPTTDPVTSATWEDNATSGGLLEGGLYYYCVRAFDCMWEQSPIDGIPEYDYTMTSCVAEGESPITDAEIAVQNISDCLLLGDAVNPVSPGTIHLYPTDDITTPGVDESVATTSGEFHNEVNFYIQNTSRASLTIDQMNVVWDNPDIQLADVTFGPATTGTSKGPNPELTYPASAGPNDLFDVGRVLTSVATSTSEYSGAIPVTLRFVNAADGSVSAFTDMRGLQLKLEFKFTNHSMPANEAHSLYVGGFTTGDVNGTNPLQIAITGGPSINFVYQDQPTSPYSPYVIDTTGSFPSTGYPEVGGLRDVGVLANVTWPFLDETLDQVLIGYYISDPSVMIDPTTVTFTNTTMLQFGTYAIGEIPGQQYSKGFWYYLMAKTAEGNFDRMPNDFDQYYYYLQKAFDECGEVPMAPTGLSVTDAGFLSWSSVTQYVGEFDIPPTDPLTYNIYKKDGIGGTGAFMLLTTVGDLSYTDPYVNVTSTQALTYAVTALNSCADPGPNESAASREAYICPVKTGDDCIVESSDNVIYTYDSFSITLKSCSAANSGTVDVGAVKVTNTSTGAEEFVKVNEIDDGGVVGPITFWTMDGSYADPYPSDGYVYATDPYGSGRMVDELVITSAMPFDTMSTTSFSCATTVVTVVVNPCYNIPEATTLNDVTFFTTGSSKGIQLNWDPVTTNTDGSPAVYYTESVNYEVWYYTSGLPETLLGTFSPADLTEQSDGSLQVFISATGSPNTAYTFYILATDTCTPLRNESYRSNEITQTW